MADQFRVTMIACIAGNPLKAWHGSTGPEDTEHVPDDVWEDQVYEYDDLAAAKSFVAGLPTQTTTHVLLQHSEDGTEWTTIFDRDAGSDHLVDAAPGIAMPHTVDRGGVPSASTEVPEAPPLMPAQGTSA